MARNTFKQVLNRKIEDTSLTTKIGYKNLIKKRAITVHCTAKMHGEKALRK